LINCRVCGKILTWIVLSVGFSIVKIIEENLDVIQYYFDGKELDVINNTELFVPNELLTDGIHQLKIFVNDTVGHTTTKEFSFQVDKLPPTLVIKSPKNGSSISNTIGIELEIMERNLDDFGGIVIDLPNGETIFDETAIKFDTKTVEDGIYDIKISVNDKAGNNVNQTISVNIDNSRVKEIETIVDDKNYFVIIGIILGILIGTISVLIAVKKIRTRKNQNKVYMQFFDNDS